MLVKFSTFVLYENGKKRSHNVKIKVSDLAHVRAVKECMDSLTSAVINAITFEDDGTRNKIKFGIEIKLENPEYNFKID